MAETSHDMAEANAEKEATRIEWAIGIISSLVVAALIAFLLYEGSSGAGSPPELRIEVERTIDFPETGHVRFAVFNSGDTAASKVVVSAVERAPDGTVKREQSVEIDYIPANSNEMGGLYVDPEAEATFLVEGYVDP